MATEISDKCILDCITYIHEEIIDAHVEMDEGEFNEESFDEIFEEEIHGVVDRVVCENSEEECDEIIGELGFLTLVKDYKSEFGLEGLFEGKDLDIKRRLIYVYMRNGVIAEKNFEKYMEYHESQGPWGECDVWSDDESESESDDE